MANVKERKWKGDEREEKTAKDYDIEDPDVPEESDADDSQESVDEAAAVAHYVDVGKSKLRRKQQPALGPRYRGSRVSREALEAGDEDEDEGEDATRSDSAGSSNYEDAREDFDDPDAADLVADQEGQEDAEIDSDDAFDENDEAKFKDYVFRGSSQTMPKKGKSVPRPTASDYMMSSEQSDEDEDEDDESEGVDSDEISEDDSLGGLIDREAKESDADEDEEGDDSGLSEDESEDGSESDEDGRPEVEDDAGKSAWGKGAGQGKHGGIVDSGERKVAGSLVNTVQQEVAKANAVRQQRKTFDALLNIRIRLQKSLVAINSLSSVESRENQSEPYEAAEAAALKLWSAIDGFRTNIQTEPDKTSRKRKRVAEMETPTRDLWDSMEAVEERAKTRRLAVLEHWSHQARNMRMVDDSSHKSKDKSSRKSGSNPEESWTSKLENEMKAPDVLVDRTRKPRSCAPVQVVKKVNSDPTIYDDADFYQLLLKDLVDQRSGDSSNAGMAAATVHYKAVKEAKAKRHVDTKASKGRKMRFNVHETLQNFMASEDRRSWEQSAIDRLFGTLFGQKMTLNEEQTSDADEEMGGAALEEEGLRLFRN
ncbi:TRAUB-domain-containing protein [Xylariaceae sp. FL0804]|nr:TRAUB-domain-containing protein [Xylariaceae sp. FL0804]